MQPYYFLTNKASFGNPGAYDATGRIIPKNVSLIINVITTTYGYVSLALISHNSFNATFERELKFGQLDFQFLSD